MGLFISQYDISVDGLVVMSIKSWDIGMVVKQDYCELIYVIEGIIMFMVNSGEMEKLFFEYGLSYEILDYFCIE